MIPESLLGAAFDTRSHHLNATSLITSGYDQPRSVALWSALAETILRHVATTATAKTDPEPAPASPVRPTVRPAH
jgi:hypothetical protein